MKKTGKKNGKKSKLPRGWNEKRIRRVLNYYENQSDGEAAAEFERAAKSDTIVSVPRDLVPIVRSLIADRAGASARLSKLVRKIYTGVPFKVLERELKGVLDQLQAAKRGKGIAA